MIRPCSKCQQGTIYSETQPILRQVPLPVFGAIPIPIEKYLPDSVRRYRNYQFSFVIYVGIWNLL
ncbi:MAG: hypothetical protein ACRD5E_02730 [Nitrososphaeraceae archaeon]